MKKRLEKRTKRVVPALATEAKEAAWWYENRNEFGKELLAAVKSGEAQVLTKARLQERIAASKKAFGSCGGATDSRRRLGFGPKGG